MALKISTMLVIDIDLLDSERFVVMEPYGESDIEISVDKISIKSATSVWMSGRILLRSGDLGIKRRTYLFDIDDLPEQVAKDVLRRLLEVL